MKSNWRELRFVFLGLVVILLAALAFPRLRFVKEFDEFSLVDEEALAKVNAFNGLFESNEETSVLILENNTLWDSDRDYARLNEIVQELEQTMPDQNFYSITNIEFVRKGVLGFGKKKLFHEIISKDIDKLKKNYQDVFSKFESENAKYALVFIESELGVSPDEKICFDVLKQVSPEIKAYFFNREGFVNELNTLSFDNLIWNTITVLGLLLIGFYFFARSLQPIFLIGFVLLINLAFLVIYLAVLDIQISPQLSSLPALIVILTFSDCIHITWAQQNYKQNIRKQILLPLSLTSLTNCIGFLFFLSISENDILYDLSVLAILSIVSSLLVSVFVLFQFKVNDWGYRIDRLNEFSNFLVKSFRHFQGRFALLVLILLLALGGVFVVNNITVERNFKANNELPFSEASDILQNYFFGSYQLTLEISPKEGRQFTDDRVANALNLVEKDLDSLFDFLYISSPNVVLKRFNRFYRHERANSFDLPGELSERKLKEFRLFKNVAGWKEVVNHNTGRLILGYNSNSLLDRNKLYQELEKTFANLDLLNCQIVSLSYFQDKEEFRFLRTVSVGFLLLFFLSSGLIFILKKSFLLAFKFLIANTLPICFALGLMVVFEVPLNSNSFLMLSVLIGVSLDDSIYYIYKNRLGDMKSKIQIPIVLTSFSLAFAMLGFVTSSYSWIQPFSIILALSFLLSLLFDMLLLDNKK